jgi:hypothetical protein
MNTEILIKNGDGEYVKFSGVRKTRHHKYLQITSHVGETLNCSLNHRFIINGIETIASELKEDDILSNNFSVFHIELINAEIELYDPVSVNDTHSFYHNGDIISHNCDFIGSSLTLIASDTLLALQARAPIKEWQDTRYYVEPKAGHNYIMTVDVSKGRGQDYSTFTVFDVTSTTFSTVCIYRSNMISPLMFPEYITRAAKVYNDALVVIENNDAGQVVCNSVYYDYEYDNTFVSSAVKNNGIGVTMTKRVKRIGCSNLKDLIERGRLEVCDADAVTELSSFEPKGDSYAASGGCHDDLVMNMVLFAWYVSTDSFTSLTNHELKDLLYAEKIREMEEDLPPFGFISRASNSDKPDSAVHYEQQISDLREWNTL